jgi:hypothetical protein
MLLYYYLFVESDDKRNEAQRAMDGDTDAALLSKTQTEVGPSGSEHEVTYYFDGSSTVNFGGMGGKVNYDKYGREC